MNAQTETADSSLIDIVKQVASVFLVIGGIAAFYFFSQVPMVYRVLGLLGLLAAVLGLMYTTQIGQKTWSFMLESKLEVRKIVWPSRDETVKTTMMVFAMVLVVGMVLWCLDMFLFWAIRLLTGQVG